MESELDGARERALRKRFGLIPSEDVLHAAKPARVVREGHWIVAPLLMFASALVTALFAGLLHAAGMAGVNNSIALSALLAAVGIGLILLPSFLYGEAMYVITDRRILVRRGKRHRSMLRSHVTYMKIHWHRHVPNVGHLECVIAVPFGPLSRKLRIMMRDVREPDRILALLRDVEPREHAGSADVGIMDRLDDGEEIVWGARPAGGSIGWRELCTSLLGVAIFALGLRYGFRTAQILLDLEGIGLKVQSAEWMMLFLAVAISGVTICAVGLYGIWHGTIRARALGQDTEYLLTDRRLLIRRGNRELSVNRNRIVDVAVTGAGNGLSHVFLVLDSPQSRALATSGALGPILPSRNNVPPILFEVADVEPLRQLAITR